MQVAFATENIEKSKGINLDIMTQKVWMKAGDNPDCPYVLKAAFTGTAACNIKGNLDVLFLQYHP